MNNKTLWITIGGLVVIITVLAILNINTLSNRQQTADNPELTITSRGEKITITLAEIQDCDPVDFEITLRSSGKPARDLIMTGVPLSAVLDEHGVSLADKQQIIARAIDGYVVAYDISELAVTDHLFIVYRENGQRLKSKAEGGSGPLLLVARQDEFGQRWCKFLVEVDIE